MTNKEIREVLKAEHIPYWQVADVLGVHENTVIRKMRHELSSADKEAFLKAITEIKSKKKTA